jgi:hypothetical protein
MTGLIWLIQLVHYPSFNYISKNEFNLFHAFHSQVITFVVGPIMLVELGTSLFLVLNQKLSLISCLNFLGLVLIWIATAFLSVPTHNKLGTAVNAESIAFLISTNWIRTVLWTMRSGLLIYSLTVSLKDNEIHF